MKIQEARHIGRVRGPLHADRVELAALTMAAVLDEIEQVCVLHSPGHPAVEQIAAILDGERAA